MEINPVHLLNHQIIRDLPFGVMAVDRDFRIIDWNFWMEKNTGLLRIQVQGKEISQFLPEHREREMLPVIARVFEQGKKFIFSSEVAEQFLNFSQVPNQSRIRSMIQDTEFRPLFDIEGEVAAVCILIHDVTERVIRLKDLENLNRSFAIAHKALEEANRVKTDFLANTSHELRTPLTNILGFVELLENGLAESEEEEKAFFSNIRESATHLLDSINNILRTAEIQAGKFEMNLRPVNLGEVLSEVQARIHPEIKKKGLDFAIEMEDFELAVLVDYEEFKQVLINILDNAIKFTDSGSIRVVVQRAGVADDRAEIRVIDTGHGIDPEKIKLVFEPFRQIDSSTTRKHGGTGLGLSISRSMMERMNGTIEITSPGLGQGTTVTLRLAAVW